MKKTNAVRILDKHKISYELLEYEVDETDLSADHAAKKAGVPLERVFKTLVARGDKTGVMVACIPGGAELNLKKIAGISRDKKVELVPLKEVQQLTGYIRGGVSPIGMKKSYPTYIDDSALRFDSIMISAGMRGCQIKIRPEDLLKTVSGAFVEIANIE
ncbi:Cys-tRNA(Pro)/Cys-tRNA(Cys) deacylase [Natronincola peptidivorans]|uniref:Cys-tRNA(Pro)/Cys-tRNA(Cys) deacylase n=1 Tax=Natronincola peptidivorans TaxID=426128 RepID=A0A1I0FR58_9FIRM|nr:Cys-tRNA(Pro) deacylase [Natronincola peptidivorans]SET60882.1 Cys-tRNA(Pro)/Cys-tRNA(Cys) deacylase [Natronincola peptidivorans]